VILPDLDDAVNDRPWRATWGEVIRSLDLLHREDFVCFDGRPGSPEDPCLVADSQTLDEDVPQEAEVPGWRTRSGRAKSRT